MSTNTNLLTVTRFATAADVRAWAVANNLEVATTRGRLPFEVVTAYNKANSLKYRPGAAKKVVDVEVKDKRGRKAVRKVNVGDARALLAANGVETGKRGRLSLAQLVQAWELGTNSKGAEKASEAVDSTVE